MPSGRFSCVRNASPYIWPDGAEQRVVGGQVEAELLPHRMVVDNCGFLTHGRPLSCARRATVVKYQKD